MMDERYGLQLLPEQKEMFHRWHRLDAVDKRECPCKDHYESSKQNKPPDHRGV